ncbi:MAG TPA: DUF2231 domain-containing protein [Candidatus Dormibacteraeota bacterium]
MSWRERVVGFVEEQRWLDQLGDAATDVARPFLDDPAARRPLAVLRGEWLGHPLHPPLTDLPIGCWTASVLLDLVCESRAAGVLTAAGSAAAVGTMAAGFADWTASEGRIRRLGVLHAVLNTGALGIQLCSLGARLRRRKLRALSLSLLGLSVAAASAWLGGEMVYGQPVRTEQ